jgi:Flp pilus assembly protein TadG
MRRHRVRTVKNSSLPAHRHRQGAAAVEFAIILPLLVTIVLGCVDFGRFAYSYIALTNAARAGAAFGCMNVYTTATLGDWTVLVKKAAADEMVQQTGFDPTKLEVAVTPITETTGLKLKRVKVEATYPFKTIVNWPGLPTGNGTPLAMKRTVVLRAIRD